MKKQPYNNEDLIKQVQNYLNKILAETGSRQKKLKDSITATLDILNDDLKLVQEQNGQSVYQEPQPTEGTATENNNNDTNILPEENTEEVEKQDDATEVSKQDEATEISNVTETVETKSFALIG